MKTFKKPIALKANDDRVLIKGKPIPVDFRVVSEERYQDLVEALQHALRVAKTLPNKDSIGVKMLIKNLEQTLNKAL